MLILRRRLGRALAAESQSVLFVEVEHLLLSI
jgi:hypothetical protein